MIGKVPHRLPKLPPLLIASSRAFTSNKAFMLSSMPCTVFSSPLRSGLPSTKTQPTVVLVFILSSESCHPFCTSISARNVLTVFGVFSYKSWSHPCDTEKKVSVLSGKTVVYDLGKPGPHVPNPNS